MPVSPREMDPPSQPDPHSGSAHSGSGHSFDAHNGGAHSGGEHNGGAHRHDAAEQRKPYRTVYVSHADDSPGPAPPRHSVHPDPDLTDPEPTVIVADACELSKALRGVLTHEGRSVAAILSELVAVLKRLELHGAANGPTAAPHNKKNKAHADH